MAGEIDSRAKDIIGGSDALFGKRLTLMSLWQEMADNFNVERADFTRVRTLGTDFAANLMTSYPLMIRRDLQNAISTMLRPSSQEWFAMRATREDIEVRNARVWLEWASGVMRRALYDRQSQFVKATKQADGDYVTFGQCVIQPTLSQDGTRLLFRTWHLRDCAWRQGFDTRVNELHRKWKPELKTLYERFPNSCSPKVKLAYEGKKPQDLYREIECRHIVIPSEGYDPPPGQKKTRQPFVSLYIDTENEWIVEEIGVPTLGYVVPRWQTWSESQYAFSPATVTALPDARLAQSMMRVLLEAGEKATTPPMLAVQEAIRSDVNLYAGGVTWAAADYDGKLKEVLEPLNQDLKGLPLGIEMNKDVREMLAEAFFLNKLTMPERGAEMTAYEVGQRIQQYIREATPLFEPMEDEYNGALCEETFGLMMRNGGFGPVANIPPELRGQEVQFEFVSPLTAAMGAQKVQKFQLTGELLTQAAQLDPGIGNEVDVVTAFRDTMDGAGAPANWLRDEKVALQMRAQQAAEAQQAKQVAQAEQVANVAKTAGDAGKSLNDAMAA